MWLKKTTENPPKPQRWHPKPDPKEVKAGRKIPVGGKGGEEEEGFLLLGLSFLWVGLKLLNVFRWCTRAYLACGEHPGLERIFIHV